MRTLRRGTVGRLWLLVPLLAGSGCGLLLDIDKDYHLGDTSGGAAGGSGGGTTSSSMTNTGAGGTGGGSSTTTQTGGTGGATCSNGVKSCGQPTDCDPTGNECVTLTCEANCCGVQNATIGAGCSSGGGKVCDGNGTCVGCLEAVAGIAASYHHTCTRKIDGSLWCWGSNLDGQLGDGTTGGPACGGNCKPSPVQVSALGKSVVQVVAGQAHTCARKADGTLWCWGDNKGGQLGDGTKSGPSCNGYCQPQPVQVSALGTDVVDVAAGGIHTCARKVDGTLWCWGDNGTGELGDGTSTGQACGYGPCQPAPIQVASLGNSVADVSAGSYHTCARKADGTLWCWGLNSRGQLGDGTSTGPACGDGCKASPVQVTALGTSVAKVAAGDRHTCALGTDSSLWCWGDNESGQLGQETTGGPGCNATCEPSPVQVTALGYDTVQVVTGQYHTCARRTDGSLWCWGNNEYGQLGDGTVAGPACAGDCNPSPSQVAVLATNVAGVAPGGSHNYALKTDGSLWYWGDNSYGQLGDGTTVGPSCANTCEPSPVQSEIGMCP